MASLNYTWDEINRLPTPPTEGERYILHWLEDNLEDEYEVYFQPYLNGDRPDILVLRENGGIVVIEVKDYNLDLYEVKDEKTWTVKAGNGRTAIIASPVNQVRKYKNDLINLHISGMAEARAYNSNTYALIVPCIYFHNGTPEQVLQIKNHRSHSSSTIDYIKFYCKETLSLEFRSMLENNRINGRSKFFTRDMYDNLKQWVCPTAYEQDLMNPIELTAVQEELGQIREDRRNANIAGVPGSGKTTVLALKAFNAYLKAKKEAEDNGYSRVKPILILTFNITLRNYIHDRISMICRLKNEKFVKEAFEIQHYHNFISMYCNNNSIPYSGGIDAGGEFVLPNLTEDHYRYDTILIDEIQDFHDIWVENVQKILSENGKMYRFGDKAQNIYDRDVARRNINNYKQLRETFRLDNDIVDFANDFAKNFVDESQTIGYRQRDLFSDSELPVIRYFDAKGKSGREIVSAMWSFARQCGSVHPNDYCVMGSKIETLRYIETCLQNANVLGTRFSTMFENEGAYQSLLEAYGADGEEFDRQIKAIRRSKKYNFWDNAGNMKISTIHSFKGWEAVNGIILLENELEEGAEGMPMSELIYVALTRVRKNLLVIDYGDNEYSQFIRQWIDSWNKTINGN